MKRDRVRYGAFPLEITPTVGVGRSSQTPEARFHCALPVQVIVKEERLSSAFRNLGKNSEEPQEAGCRGDAVMCLG